jgi:hypothetical protein
MGCNNIEESFKEIIEADIPTSLARFGKELDAQWIEKALQEAGTATIRRRKLPAILVIWLVIGMALFRDRSIREVVSHLGLVLPSQKKKGNVAGKSLSPGAIPPARERVGAMPLMLIFEQIAWAWSDVAADEHRWKGLALYGIDGTTLRIPDTDENREAFGLPGTGRGQSGYPQVRLVALMALRSHLISAVAFGAYSGKRTGEHSLAQDLWPKVPLQSLVIMDRGFIDYGQFFRLSHNAEDRITGDRHWLVRGKKNLKWKTLKVLGPGDELVELSIGKAARKKDPTLPKKMVARVIHYQISGHKPQFLLTSLIDATAYPAKEVVELYHERWEIELGYDEVKTHMLERQESLRSQKPEGVKQEIWGILVAYNLVRKKMLDVAREMGVDPLRVSFRHSLQLIRVFCLVEAWTMAPGNLPKRLTGLVEMMGLLLLPERRRERRYKRHVKIKMSGYKRNPGRPSSK